MVNKEIEEAAHRQFLKDLETDYFHDESKANNKAKAVALPEIIPTGVGKFGFFAADTAAPVKTDDLTKKKDFGPSKT